MVRPCISLLTDFGLHDSYVGQMKGAIAAVNPDALVVDITHAIPPQQDMQGAVILADAVEAFPAGTIHLAIVDPGVGSVRRAVAAEIGPHRLVCPDNGLLTLLLKKHPLLRAVQLDEPRWWRSVISGTFHGRDLFAPVAAAWSLGCDLSELGSPVVEPLVTLPIAECQVSGTGESGPTQVQGQIVVIDYYGNLISNIPRSAIPRDAPNMRCQIAGQDLTGIVHCYSDRPSGESVALFGSSDRLEVAIVNGNAAAHFSVGIGAPIEVCWGSGS
jgi:S-adenosylmethionine hydrolase